MWSRLGGGVDSAGFSRVIFVIYQDVLLIRFLGFQSVQIVLS